LFLAAVLVPLTPNTLAAGCQDGRVRIIDLAAATVAAVLPERHRERVTALVVLGEFVSSSGGELASASYDGAVRLWGGVGTAAAACTATLVGHTSAVLALALLADRPDRQLASGSSDRTVRLWDVASHTCVGILRAVGPLRTLAPLPDGRLAGATQYHHLCVWDTRPPPAATSRRAVNAVPSVTWYGELGDATNALLPLPDATFITAPTDADVSTLHRWQWQGAWEAGVAP